MVICLTGEYDYEIEINPFSESGAGTSFCGGVVDIPVCDFWRALVGFCCSTRCSGVFLDFALCWDYVDTLWALCFYMGRVEAQRRIVSNCWFEVIRVGWSIF